MHRILIRLYGGSHGVRNIELLESAVGQPSISFGTLLHPDLASMAAAYFYHIIKNHPFIDGNKRTGSVAALFFLRLNNYTIDISQEELINLAVGVATSKISKEKLTNIIESTIRLQ
ncbi:type II toxin-antitoxin system death-on-curing family toxin [Candidatus Dependentiae bacterium]|nr:type II toxin-antitoxin system death-on-curing family toxin [Candidatus Dependentiae bacterium]